MINKYKKIVIKIGSNSIVNSKTKKIKSKWLISLCKDIAKIHKSKKENEKSPVLITLT